MPEEKPLAVEAIIDVVSHEELEPEPEPDWLFEGTCLLSMTCSLCGERAPEADGIDASREAARVAGFKEEKDEQCDADGDLVCCTVRWICPDCGEELSIE